MGTTEYYFDAFQLLEVYEKKPKIYVCSRTHAQLTQLIYEFRKTDFSNLGINIIVLGMSFVAKLFGKCFEF